MWVPGFELGTIGRARNDGQSRSPPVSVLRVEVVNLGGNGALQVQHPTCIISIRESLGHMF